MSPNLQMISLANHLEFLLLQDYYAKLDDIADDELRRQIYTATGWSNK